MGVTILKVLLNVMAILIAHEGCLLWQEIAAMRSQVVWKMRLTVIAII